MAGHTRNKVKEKKKKILNIEIQTIRRQETQHPEVLQTNMTSPKRIKGETRRQE